MPYGMSGSNYNAGDYYRGDYYQGDPGLLGTLFKGVTGAIGGFVTGGPLGAIGGAARGLLGGGKPATPATGTALVPSLPPPPVLQAPAGVGIGYFNPQGGGLGLGVFPEKPAPTFPGGMQIPTVRGMHYNKSTYETRGGGTSRWGPSGSLQIHPKGTVLVKSRRMNVGNARALKRALRRARGFERLARSVMVVHRFKKHPTKRVGRKR